VNARVDDIVVYAVANRAGKFLLNLSPASWTEAWGDASGWTSKSAAARIAQQAANHAGESMFVVGDLGGTRETREEVKARTEGKPHYKTDEWGTKWALWQGTVVVSELSKRLMVQQCIEVLRRHPNMSCTYLSSGDTIVVVNRHGTGFQVHDAGVRRHTWKFGGES
jgi:hypothetical protein